MQLCSESAEVVRRTIQELSRPLEVFVREVGKCC